MEEHEAWTLERGFWLGSEVYYEAVLDPECLMAFPGMGILGAAEILESVRGAPRWSSVEMTDLRIARPEGAMTVLGYRAVGRRDGAAPYTALCTSTYRRDGDAWKLVQHQQTLAG